MIVRLESPAEAQRWCAELAEQGRRIGFVPTMGALHEGHLALVRRAGEVSDAVVVSVFVNPLQFDDPLDLERYPRDLDRDARLLEEAGAAMVFTGTLEQFFPGAVGPLGELASDQWVDPGPAARGLEGSCRPGHFRGVATIVDRLFEICRPAVAIFGQKDFQQTLVVRDLARRRGGPAIEVAPTVREPSGLARSSRNELLSASDRRRAAALFRALRAGEGAWREGARRPDELRAPMRAVLDQAEIVPEYLELRDPEAWSEHEPAGPLERAIALVAARVGGVRLIDNHLLSGLFAR